MPPANSGHFEDFLVDQLENCIAAPNRLQAGGIAAAGGARPVRNAPLVSRLNYARFDQNLVYSITPIDHMASLLESLPRNLATRLQTLYEATSGTPMQQSQQEQPEQTGKKVGKSKTVPQHDMTLCEMSSLSLVEDLTAAQVRTLANKMKDRPIRVHCTHTHETYETTQLVAFCLCMYKNSSRPLTMLAKFAIYDATRVISHLVHIAPTIFNIDQIGIFLQTMMLYIVQARLDSVTALRRRLGRESALSECGCLLIATYLITRLEKHKHGQLTNDMAVIAGSIKKIRDPGLDNDEDINLTASKLVIFNNELQRMSNIIFHEEQLCTTSEPWGWFLGILLEGAGQYVDYVKEHKDKHISRTSTILAFSFAFAGLIPFAGQFMGIIGLVADKALHQFWQSDDYRPFIRKLDGLLDTKVVLTGHLVVQKHPGLAGLEILMAKQHCDDVLNVKRRTQAMGAYAPFHKKAGSRVIGFLDRAIHRH